MTIDIHTLPALPCEETPLLLSRICTAAADDYHAGDDAALTRVCAGVEAELAAARTALDRASDAAAKCRRLEEIGAALLAENAELTEALALARLESVPPALLAALAAEPPPPLWAQAQVWALLIGCGLLLLWGWYVGVLP